MSIKTIIKGENMIQEVKQELDTELLSQARGFKDIKQTINETSYFIYRTN